MKAIAMYGDLLSWTACVSNKVIYTRHWYKSNWHKCKITFLNTTYTAHVAYWPTLPFQYCFFFVFFSYQCIYCYTVRKHVLTLHITFCEIVEFFLYVPQTYFRLKLELPQNLMHWSFHRSTILVYFPHNTGKEITYERTVCLWSSTCVSWTVETRKQNVPFATRLPVGSIKPQVLVVADSASCCSDNCEHAV